MPKPAPPATPCGCLSFQHSSLSSRIPMVESPYHAYYTKPLNLYTLQTQTATCPNPGYKPAQLCSELLFPFMTALLTQPHKCEILALKLVHSPELISSIQLASPICTHTDRHRVYPWYPSSLKSTPLKCRRSLALGIYVFPMPLFLGHFPQSQLFLGLFRLATMLLNRPHY